MFEIHFHVLAVAPDGVESSATLWIDPNGDPWAEMLNPAKSPPSSSQLLERFGAFQIRLYVLAIAPDRVELLVRHHLELIRNVRRTSLR